MRRAVLVLVFSLGAGGCKTSPEEARKALASPEPATREKAAAALRAMYAKDPTSIGDHGEAYWAERLDQARGKKTPEVVAILGGAQISGGEAGGGGETVSARLDDFWTAELGRSTRGDDTVFHTGKPRRAVLHVDAAPTASFTGTWTTYYVSGAVYETTELRAGVRLADKTFHEGGQVWTEIAYVDGKADGKSVTRSPNGTLERETTYSKGDAVTEKTFFPSGKLECATVYRDRNIDSTRCYLESGTLSSCSVYAKGIPAPCAD